LAHPDAADVILDDWLVGLQSSDEQIGSAVWIELQASKIADKKLESARADKLLTAWVRCLASAACGQPAGGFVVGADAVVRVTPPTREAARSTLLALMQDCHGGLRGDTPVPTAVLTGLAFLNDPAKARLTFEGSDHGGVAEGGEACLARLYPDYAALCATAGFESSTRRLYEPYREWLAHQVAVEELPDHAAVEGLGDE
jgi:exodeoxyribonuclease V gamma subunit